MEVIIKIEASNDFLDAYATNLESVTAGGETMQEVKSAILESIEIQKELGNIDNIAYELVYKYDTKSLLRYYGRIFTMPALERLTGARPSG